MRPIQEASRHSAVSRYVLLEACALQTTIRPEPHSRYLLETTYSVTFLRIRDQHGFNAAFEEGVMELSGLLGRSTTIECAADVEGRRLCFVRMHDWTVLKILTARIGVVILKHQRHKVC